MPSETPESQDTKIGLRDAVSAAERFLKELYPSSIQNVLLEEVEERAGEWLITFGFDTGRIVQQSIPGTLLTLPNRQEMTRVFKTFVVDAGTGKVRAMKIHPSALSV